MVVFDCPYDVENLRPAVRERVTVAMENVENTLELLVPDVQLVDGRQLGERRQNRGLQFLQPQHTIITDNTQNTRHETRLSVEIGMLINK